MKHLAPHEIEQSAVALPAGIMSRSERLDRWAMLLYRHAGAIRALEGIEFLSGESRRALNGPNTPMAIAFQDPILRDQGLAGDTLGAAMDFFELSDREAHQLFCDCNYHGTMTGDGLARRVRSMTAPPPMAGLWRRARALVT